SNNPLRFIDSSGHTETIVGDGTPGTYYYYDKQGIRRVHGSKEIDYEYYDEIFTVEGINGIPNVGGLRENYVGSARELEGLEDPLTYVSVGGGLARGLLVSTAKTVVKSVAFNSGRAGELYLAKLVGGNAKPVYFKTSLGARYVDVLKDGIAYESKVGYKTLTAFNKKQVLKDVELLKKGTVDSVEWHFFKSEITGKSGASQQLLDFLTQNGIKYTIHP
ncbi:hypothetical protein, partial [Brevibacillus sp. HD1.4A]